MVDARRYHERTDHSPEALRDAGPCMDPSMKPRPFKRYRNVDRVDLAGIRPPQLPALAAIATSTTNPVGDPCALDRETVATLCYLAAGITQETEYKGERVRFRAASCTGNLHHIDLYLVCGDLPDLDAGVYHFDPTRCALETLRRGDFRDVLAATADGGTADAPVWVVATSTWWRNAWKYAQRTYRHAFWDGGTVLANLLASAHALALRTRVDVGFVDDAVTALLGLDHDEEAPIAAVPIGAGDAPTDGPAADPIDPPTAPLSSDRIEYPLIVDAWEQSRLADGDAVSTWREACREGVPGRVDAGDGERVDLDPVDASTASSRPLLATIRRRGSKRTFGGTGPSRRQLGTILDRATRGVPGDWTTGEATGLAAVACYVLATDVPGVPDGRYQYHPATDELERLGETSVDDKARLALGQPWGGDAHVNVYLMADVDAIVRDLGNRGYRLAQLEAGVTLGRLYLATAAHRDLGGTGLTFEDGAVTEHLAPRAAGQRPMAMFALGRIDPEKEAPV